MYQLEDNQFIIKDTFVEIKVKYKQIWYTFIIDRDDLLRVQTRHWRTSHKKNKVYALSGSKTKNNIVYLHNFILNYKYQSGYEVDHINGNEFDNRKENLRIIKRIENIQNVGVRNDNKIGIRGVCFDKKHNKYIASFSYTPDIKEKPQRYYFKPFSTLQEAIWCRKIAENYFGLEMIDRNPKAIEYYNKLVDYQKEEIEKYTIDKILRKQR